MFGEDRTLEVRHRNRSECRIPRPTFCLSPDLDPTVWHLHRSMNYTEKISTGHPRDLMSLVANEAERVVFPGYRSAVTQSGKV